MRQSAKEKVALELEIDQMGQHDGFHSRYGCSQPLGGNANDRPFGQARM